MKRIQQLLSIGHIGITLAVILSLCLVGCSSKKATTELNPPPSWVNQKPSVPGYYVGIGGTRKVGTTPEYTAQARKEALSDMVADISSRVSSSSVLHSIETQEGLTESFTQRIEIETDDYVEGFEPVDSYETETMYWVYYRIDKNTYHDKKAQKKQEAINNALAKLQAGDNLLEQARPLEALSPYVQGLAALKNYLGEETMAQYNNRQVDIGSQLYNRIKSLHKSIDIEEPSGSLHYKSGTVVQKPITFKVTYQQKPMAQVPVKFHYTGGYLTNDRTRSDTQGKVSCILGKISGVGHHQLHGTVVWQDLLNGSTADLQVRGLLKSFTPISASVNLLIQKPSIKLAFHKNLCKEISCSLLESHFTTFVNQQEIEVNDSADYLLKISASYSTGPSTADFKAVFIQGEHQLTDPTESIIKTVKARRIRGVGKSTKAAKQQALEAFMSDAQNRYWPELLNEIL